MDSLTPKTKVLIIEDSKLMQNILTELMRSDKEIEVVGCAQDPYEARELIKRTNPDVITLDIMLPQMDGITFLKHLMRLRPTPVLMISSFTGQGSTVALEALANGAVECFPKPTSNDLAQPEHYAQVLVKTIKDVSRANVQALSLSDTVKKLENYTLLPVLIDSPLLKRAVIAMGASIGGVDALEQVLSQLPQVMPPILVIQRLKKSEFGSSFVRHINQACSLSVVEAMHGQQLFPGHVYVAPTDYPFRIKRKDTDYFCLLEGDDSIQGQQPSMDVLLNTVAAEVKGNSIGILLTGEGEDGVNDLRQIKQAGGATIVQDQETSVAWEMPGAAVRANVVDYVLPLDSIPPKILEVLDEKGRSLIS